MITNKSGQRIYPGSKKKNNTNANDILDELQPTIKPDTVPSDNDTDGDTESVDSVNDSVNDKENNSISFSDLVEGYNNLIEQAIPNKDSILKLKGYEKRLLCITGNSAFPEKLDIRSLGRKGFYITLAIIIIPRLLVIVKTFLEKQKKSEDKETKGNV
jgi:hypothetical protein